LLVVLMVVVLVVVVLVVVVVVVMVVGVGVVVMVVVVVVVVVVVMHQKWQCRNGAGSQYTPSSSIHHFQNRTKIEYIKRDDTFGVHGSK
jgi:hypothetical protein